MDLNGEIMENSLVGEINSHGELIGDVPGSRGPQGIGIASIEQTTTSHEDDGINIVTTTLTTGETSTFQIKNGSKGDKGDKGDIGNVDIVTFDVIDGKLIMYSTREHNYTFQLNDNKLEVVYNG